VIYLNNWHGVIGRFHVRYSVAEGVLEGQVAVETGRDEMTLSCCSCKVRGAWLAGQVDKINFLKERRAKG
jgi:hypothetical protein